jgi:hypothetical protein
MSKLQQYLERLRALPEEVPIEPELKHERQKQDKKIKYEALSVPWGVMIVI